MLATIRPQDSASRKVTQFEIEAERSGTSEAIVVTSFSLFGNACSTICQKVEASDFRRVILLKKFHSDVDGGGRILRRPSGLADDAQALGEANHDTRGLLGIDAGRNRPIGLPFPYQPAEKGLVLGDAGIDTRSDFPVEDCKLDRAADHQAAAPALDAF